MNISDRIIFNYDLFLRDLERDQLGLEVPYMKEKYLLWLSERGYKSNTRIHYISVISRLDDYLFQYLQYDYATKFHERFSCSKVKDCLVILNEMDEACRFFVEDDVAGGFLKPETGNSYISILDQYLKFLKNHVLPSSVPPSSKHRHFNQKFYFQDEFKDWLISRSISYTTSNQYISCINRLRKDFFCKLTPICKDPLLVLERCINEAPQSAPILLEKLLARIEQEIEAPVKTRHIDPKVMENCKSAFKIYITFVTPYLNEAILQNQQKGQD